MAACHIKYCVIFSKVGMWRNNNLKGWEVNEGRSVHKYEAHFANSKCVSI